MRIIMYGMLLLFAVPSYVYSGGEQKRPLEEAPEGAPTTKKHHVEEYQTLYNRAQKQLVQIKDVLQEIQERKVKCRELEHRLKELESASGLMREHDVLLPDSMQILRSSAGSDSEGVILEPTKETEIYLFRYDYDTDQAFVCYEGKSIKVMDILNQRLLATIAVPRQGDILDLRIHPYKPKHCIISTSTSIQVVGPKGTVWSTGDNPMGYDAPALYINPADPRELWSGHGNGFARLWDLDTGECLKEVKMFDEKHSDDGNKVQRICSLCITDRDQLVVSTFAGKVMARSLHDSSRVWDTFDVAPESSLECNSDTSKVSIVGQGIQVRDLRSRQWVDKFKVNDEITYFWTSPVYPFYSIIGLKNGTVELWNLKKGDRLCLTSAAGHKEGVIGGVITKQGKLISVGEEGSIKVWDLINDGKELKLLKSL